MLDIKDSLFQTRYKLLKEEYQLKENLIIVDIQPAYINYMNNINLPNLLQYCSEFENVLWFFNGQSLGYDDNIEQWLNYELDFWETDKINFYEKEYGYFRNLIDNDYDDETIVNIVKYMVDHKINDSRDLTDQDLKNLNITDDEHLIEILSDEGIWLNENILNELEKFNPCTLIGGGKNECLKEIEIYCQVAEIEYQLNQKFIY